MAVKRAYYRFIPLWLDEETCEVVPRSTFWFGIFDFVLWVDCVVLKVKEFKILVQRDDEHSN